MTEKQYPELPDPTARRSYDNLLKRDRYDAVPITSTQPGIYSHTRMFTEDQTRAFADATCAKWAQAAPAAVAIPLTKLQRKAIAVCFTSDKVSVSEVQRQLSISYADAQTLCQSIVDLGLTDGLELAPSLKRGAPAPQAAPAAQGDAEDAALIEALERVYLWMDRQSDAQSKGGHATFDLMMLREERDAVKAAIDAAKEKKNGT